MFGYHVQSNNLLTSTLMYTGYFSIFPVGNEFDIKIGYNVKCPWVCPSPRPWGLTLTGALFLSLVIYYFFFTLFLMTR